MSYDLQFLTDSKCMCLLYQWGSFLKEISWKRDICFLLTCQHWVSPLAPLSFLIMWPNASSRNLTRVIRGNFAAEFGAHFCPHCSEAEENNRSGGRKIQFLTWKLWRRTKLASQWGKSFVSRDCPDHKMQPFDNWVSAGEGCERWPFDLGRNAVKVGNVLSVLVWGENMENSPSHSAHRLQAWFYFECRIRW